MSASESASEIEKRLLRDVQQLPSLCTGGALAIGNFDGVHLGHAQLIERLLKAAERCGGPAVVLTFDPSPLSLLKPEVVPPRLTTIERRADLLIRLGVDWVVAYPTQRSTLQWSPQEFFESIVVQRLRARAVVEGENFFFGKDRQGNVETLRELCDTNGLQLDVVRMAVSGEHVVSSSRVRELLLRGEVAEAKRCMTAPYAISAWCAAWPRSWLPDCKFGGDHDAGAGPGCLCGNGRVGGASLSGGNPYWPKSNVW